MVYEWLLIHCMNMPQIKKKSKLKSLNTKSRESESCSVVSSSLQPHVLYSPWNSPGQNTGLGRQKQSVQSLSYVRLFVSPWTAACQTSLCITNSWSLLKVMSIALVMSSNHLILCHPLLLLLSIFPSIRVFSNELVLQVVKELEFQLQHQSFQWIFRTDFL